MRFIRKIQNRDPRNTELYRLYISQLQDLSTLGVVEAFTEEAPQVRTSIVYEQILSNVEGDFALSYYNSQLTVLICCCFVLGRSSAVHSFSERYHGLDVIRRLVCGNKHHEVFGSVRFQLIKFL